MMRVNWLVKMRSKFSVPIHCHLDSPVAVDMSVRPMPSVSTTGTKKNTSTITAAGPMNSSAVALRRHSAASADSRETGTARAGARSTTAKHHLGRAHSRMRPSLNDQLVLQLRLKLANGGVGGLSGLHLARLHRGQQPVDDLVVLAELGVV